MLEDGNKIILEARNLTWKFEESEVEKWKAKNPKLDFQAQWSIETSGT